MGTRGFLGFVAEGREVIAYNHSDSYPDWLGVNTLKWLGTANLDTAAQAAPKVQLVTDATPPTDEQIEALQGSYNPRVGGPADRPTWYQLLRGTQGQLGEMIKAGYVEDGSGFPADSPFAEWGYIVDFDEKRFEVYRGFQREQHQDGRFAKLAPVHDVYWPVRLVASWPLDALPGEDAFYAAVNGDEDEDGD